MQRRVTAQGEVEEMHHQQQEQQHQACVEKDAAAGQEEKVSADSETVIGSPEVEVQSRQDTVKEEEGNASSAPADVVVGVDVFVPSQVALLCHSLSFSPVDICVVVVGCLLLLRVRLG